MFDSPWIQCNKCGVSFNNPKGVRLCCTSCSHLLCEWCFREPCPVCGRPFDKVVIGPNMPPQIKLYFEEMPQLVALLRKICKFQSDHRNAFLMRKLHIFDSICKVREAKAALQRKNQLLREKMRAALQRISNAKQFIYDCERRKAMRLEQERISQYVNRPSISRQSSGLFNQSGNLVRAAPSPRRLNELQHMSSFTNKSATRNLDSGHFSDFSPCTVRTPVQGRLNTPTTIGDPARRNEAGSILSELRRRQLTQYRNRPQFTTPQQKFRPPKQPSYRLD